MSFAARVKETLQTIDIAGRETILHRCDSCGEALILPRMQMLDTSVRPAEPFLGNGLRSARSVPDTRSNASTSGTNYCVLVLSCRSVGLRSFTD